MSSDYVENRIREALRLHGNSDAKAKKQLHAWLYEDHKFLLELTRPHINGITAYALTRVKNKIIEEHLHKKEMPSITPASDLANQAAATEKAKKDERFGETMLRSFVSEKAAKFGHEGSAAPLRRKTASQNHVDTMHMLAAASKKKQQNQDSDDSDNQE
jgi:hypothetical protein